MGNIFALSARGMPPTGRGVYIRNIAGEARDVCANFSIVNTTRRDALEQVEELGGAWLFSGPEEWRPDTWQNGLQRILQTRRRARERGLSIHGIVADPENGWQLGAITASQARSAGAFLGQALAAISSDMRVGLTSYPHWPGREACLAAAGDALWYSPQIYGRSSQDPAVLAGWYRLWTQQVGAQHCIPSIAGWRASDLHTTPQGFRDYLASIPAASGDIAWLGVGDVPGYIATALCERQPGGSAIETAALSVRNFLLRPAAIAIAVAVLVLVGVFFLAARVISERG